MTASFETWSKFQERIGCPDALITRAGYDKFVACIPKITEVFPNYKETVTEEAFQEALSSKDIWAHNAQAVLNSGLTEADMLRLNRIFQENW